LPSSTAQFPSDWLGRWEGEVEVHAPDGEQPGFDMALEIRATEDADRFDWVITYSGEFGSQVREYSLIVRDAELGAFAIDENNGIVLEARYLDGTLYSWFEVQGSHLLVEESMVRLNNGESAIRFEILATSGESTSTGADIAVTSFVPASRQQATLRRVNTQQ